MISTTAVPAVPQRGSLAALSGTSRLGEILAAEVSETTGFRFDYRPSPAKYSRAQLEALHAIYCRRNDRILAAQSAFGHATKAHRYFQSGLFHYVSQAQIAIKQRHEERKAKHAAIEISEATPVPIPRKRTYRKSGKICLSCGGEFFAKGGALRHPECRKRESRNRIKEGR